MNKAAALHLIAEEALAGREYWPEPKTKADYLLMLHHQVGLLLHKHYNEHSKNQQADRLVKIASTCLRCLEDCYDPIVYTPMACQNGCEALAAPPSRVLCANCQQNPKPPGFVPPSS